MRKTTLEYLQERVKSAPEVLETPIGKDLVELLRVEAHRNKLEECRKLTFAMFSTNSKPLRIDNNDEKALLLETLNTSLPQFTPTILLESSTQRNSLGGLIEAIKHPAHADVSSLFFQRGYLEDESSQVFSDLLSEASVPIFKEWLKYSNPLECAADGTCALSRLVTNSAPSTLSLLALSEFPDIALWPNSLESAVLSQFIYFYKDAASHFKSGEFLEKYKSLVERVISNPKYVETHDISSKSLAMRYMDSALTYFDVDGLKRFAPAGWVPTGASDAIYMGLTGFAQTRSTIFPKDITSLPRNVLEERILSTLDYLRDRYAFGFSNAYLLRNGVADKQHSRNSPVDPALGFSLRIVEKLADMSCPLSQSHMLDICQAPGSLSAKEALMTKILGLKGYEGSLSLVAAYSGLIGASETFMRKLLPKGDLSGQCDSLVIRAAMADNKTIISALYDKVSKAFPVKLGVSLASKWDGNLSSFPTLPIISDHPELMPGVLGGFASHRIGNGRDKDIQKRLLDVLALKEAGADLNAPALHVNLLHRLMAAPKKIVLPFLRQAGFSKESLNAQNASGDTLAHMAASSGEVVILDKLKGMGANLELRNNDGRTPFLCACKVRAEHTISALRRLGVDISAVDNAGDGGIASYMASAEEVPDYTCLVDMLSAGVSMSSSVPILGLFNRSFSPGILESLLERGADPNAVDKNGNILMRVVECGFGKKNFLELCASYGGNLLKSDAEGTPLDGLNADDSLELVKGVIEKQLANLQLTCKASEPEGMELW